MPRDEYPNYRHFEEWAEKTHPELPISEQTDIYLGLYPGRAGQIVRELVVCARTWLSVAEDVADIADINKENT